MQLVKKNLDYLSLLPILAVAAYFRWKGFANWSLTNDELSALYGLSLGKLSLTINDYVYNDMHPAGVQLFMYCWCKIFGISVFAVRLPFVLFGILSVALTFETGKRFFHPMLVYWLPHFLQCCNYQFYIHSWLVLTVVECYLFSGRQ